MESKLNALAIETYNTAFRNRVINDFYARNEKINGEQILQLSPVPQVNLFVIKNLFTTWKREAVSMRSPYFNYQHTSVQEAQKAYMNALSRHIAIGEADLRPLLQQAVKDTLLLLFFPIEYLQNALQQSSGTNQETSEILRYVKINQAYAQEAKAILNQQEVSDHWLSKLTEELRKQENAGRLQPESPGAYMQQFSQVLPLKPSEILQDEGLEANAKGEEEDTDFFSSLTGRLEQEERPHETPIQQTQSAPAPDENFPTVSETAHRHGQFKREEPDLSNKKPDISISRSERTEERHGMSLNEKLGKDNKSLNDKLTAAPIQEKKQETAPLHKFKKQANLRSAINLNQRFMFTKELFDGDSQAYNQAIDELEGFENYQQAYQHTLRTYARSYNWDMESEASLEFIELLQARYA